MSYMTRRDVLTGGIFLATMAMAPQAGLSQGAYPARPVRFIVGFPAGGTGDAVARLLGGELAKNLGQPLVVENKSGAGGNIATQAVLAAPADGHTIYLAQVNLPINPSVMDVGYDPHKDLTMISQIINIPVVMLTNAKSGLKTVQDVVAAGKTKNGQLTFGGVLGTAAHLGPELFARDQGFKLKLIPYRGGAQAVQALLSGEVEVVFDLMSGSLKSLIEAGSLNGIALMQAEPVKGLENIPAAGTAGVTPAGFFGAWMGVCVKSGTPAPIIAKLYSAIVAEMAKPELRQRFEQIGSEVVTSASPAEFQGFYLAELKRFGDLVKAIDYKPQ